MEICFYVDEVEHDSWAFQESKHKKDISYPISRAVNKGGGIKWFEWEKNHVVSAAVNTEVNICLRGAMSQVFLQMESSDGYLCNWAEEILGTYRKYNGEMLLFAVVKYLST